MLNGNDGADTITAGAGADTVLGGAGADRVVDNDAINFDNYDGGTDSDTIDYSANTFSSGVVSIDLGAGVVTVNISGGGALIVTGESYPPGTRLDLVLHLPDRVIPVEAEVVRHVPVAVVPGSGDPVQTRLGVRFTQIEERDREQIIRFIFAEHRRRRRKGLE